MFLPSEDRVYMTNVREAHLGVRVQAAGCRVGHADAVVGGGAADALGHVHAVAAAPALHAVVLRAPEVAPLARQLSQWGCLCAPVPQKFIRSTQLHALHGTCIQQYTYQHVRSFLTVQAFHLFVHSAMTWQPSMRVHMR